MKYKITDIHEPEDDIELQKVEKAKEFSNTVFALTFAALTSGFSYGSIIHNLTSGQPINALLATVSTIVVACGLSMMVKKTEKLYKNELDGINHEESENLSGGKQR